MLLWQHFYALLIKRLRYSSRNWLVLIAQIVVPVLIMVIAMVINRTLPGPMESPKLALDLTPFQPSHVYAAFSNKFLNQTFFDPYKSQFNPTKTVVESIASNNFEDFLINQTKATGKNTFNLHNVISLYMTDTEIVAFFNNQPFHTPPITLNALNNMWLKFTMNNDSYSIQTANHPLPPTKLDKVQDWISSGILSLTTLQLRL